MVANDIAYHKPCMNNFKAQRVPSGKPRLNLYAVAISCLVEELEAPLFHDLSGFLVKSLRDRYREILRELGIKTADQYRSTTLKLKLQQHFGGRVSILDQTCGSGFICASAVPLGDALEKLRRLEADHKEDAKYHALRQAAKILQTDCVNC
ncbi:Sarpagan bridge enzyme [Dissostichus eleginoides]|uniref:Sarpagan bridge enzyme n=1 Tax=Dissostichus eleginoides TaxID=100907 RepID=A0AAD9BT05_DISEL|nr:Sarpagan bridge enzyme [Dissostichus eleginoides]